MGFKKPPFAGNKPGNQTTTKEPEQQETPVVQEKEEKKPMAEEATVEELEEVEDPKKEKKTRNSKMLDPESIKFIRQNVKNMTYTEMAEKRGLTKHQVNRTLQYLKEQLRIHAVNTDGEKAYGTKQNKKGEDVYDWSNPLSATAKKVEKKIEDEMSRPAESRPGGGGGGGKVKQALDAELDELLGDL